MSEIQALAETMNTMFTALNEYLKQHGIEIYVYKVKLYIRESQEHKPLDEDCPDSAKCIDWIVRIKCDSEVICNALRESYMKK